MASYTVTGSDGKSYTVEYPNEPKKTGLIETIGTNLSRPGASIRERIRGLAETGNIEEAKNRADLAWDKPELSPTFQENNLKSYYGDETPSFLKTVGGLGVSAVGLAKDIITDPVQLGIGIATEGALRGVGKIPYKGLSLGERATKLPVQSTLASSEGQIAKAGKEIPKAITATEQLLKPSDKEFTRSIERGVQYNPSEQASKYISPAKNYTELTDQMRLAEGMPMQERAKIYGSTQASPTRSHLDPLDELIGNERSVFENPQANSPTSDSKLRQLARIREAENSSLNNFSDETLQDPNFWQKRKEYYQSEADKAGAYSGNEKMSARAEAYRALARGAQDKTYELDDSVKALNLENAGIGEAKKRFSQLAQVERGQAPPSISKEVSQSVRPSSAGTLAALFRKLSGEGYTNVPSLTKKISGSMSRANKAIDLANIIESLKKSSGVSIEYPNQLGISSSNTKQLPSPRVRGKFSDNKKGPIINAGGSSYIQIPQVLDSEKQALMNKWGVPERNIRETISSSDIEPVIKSSSIDTSLNPDKRTRSFIKQIMERRKRNFGA